MCFRVVPGQLEILNCTSRIPEGSKSVVEAAVADNYAPFYSTPIECTERDAAYVLDGLLYHESEIDPEEHYTDTHGYTELNFAAFAMFGKRFCPRIRGLHRQWIYRIDPDKGSAHIRVEIQT